MREPLCYFCWIALFLHHHLQLLMHFFIYLGISQIFVIQTGKFLFLGNAGDHILFLLPLSREVHSLRALPAGCNLVCAQHHFMEIAYFYKCLTARSKSVMSIQRRHPLGTFLGQAVQNIRQMAALFPP
ncbi:MAG: hypothetical protein U0519_00740 [Candidatus Gracilibacteria bacterium]